MEIFRARYNSGRSGGSLETEATSALEVRRWNTISNTGKYNDYEVDTAKRNPVYVS